MIRFVRFSILLVVCTVSCLAAPQNRTYHNDLLDPAYPNMQEWAQAGVLLKNLTETHLLKQVRLQPGEDLAAAVAIPEQVITLTPGIYQITQPLKFAHEVTLRADFPGQFQLVVNLRGKRPTKPDASGYSPWTSALLLEGVNNSGIENLTIVFDHSQSAPVTTDNKLAAVDSTPFAQDDFHVVLVRFSGSFNCWITGCTLRDSGNHPLILESSNHITVDGVEIDGTYYKDEVSGSILLRGADHCLLTGMVVNHVNHLIFTSDYTGQSNHYNVITNSRFNMDLRFENPSAKANLLQECVIAVGAWHNFPPITLSWNKQRASTPLEYNLVYYCTITRDFGPSNSSFSVADNPNQVYRILANSTFKGNVEIAGPAPQAGTLWPVK